MLAAKGGALEGVFRQNGSCFFAPGKGPRPSGGHRVRPRGFLCRERPGDALEPTLKITSGLNGAGGVEKTFQGLEASGQLLGQWWR